MQLGHKNIVIFDYYLASSHVVNGATVRYYKQSAAMTVASWWHSSLVALSGGVFFDCRRRTMKRYVSVNLVYGRKTRRYAEVNINFIVLIGKNEAEVTTNKRLCLKYCTAEAKYRQTRSIARHLCDSRATCSWRFYYTARLSIRQPISQIKRARRRSSSCRTSWHCGRPATNC